MENSYSFLSRFFHTISLGNNEVSKILFNIENFIYKNRIGNFSNSDQHVFITGLARSGTTALLNYLFATGEFATLTYANMPFLFLPNLWPKIQFGSKSCALRERSHLDGIFISEESPESFDEFFWRVYDNGKYIFNDSLIIHTPSEVLLEKFKTYVKLVILANNQRRYLSKNNNNILRLFSLKHAFPNAHFIVCFRDPLQQAFSLQKQHVRFSDLQKGNRFTLHYMNWLGHYEFGLGHKQFDLGKVETNKLLQKMSPDDINYWIIIWKNYYQYVKDNFSNLSIFVCYEEICQNPDKVLNNLYKQLFLPKPPIALRSFPSSKYVHEFIDQKLLDDCRLLYSELRKKSDV